MVRNICIPQIFCVQNGSVLICFTFTIIHSLVCYVLQLRDILTVTGCLKIEAVCLIGGTKLASALSPRARSYELESVPARFDPPPCALELDPWGLPLVDLPPIEEDDGLLCPDEDCILRLMEAKILPDLYSKFVRSIVSPRYFINSGLDRILFPIGLM